MPALSLRRPLHCALIACVLLLRAAFAEDAVPAPIPLDNKDVAAFITVPDAKALLATIDAVAKQALPPAQYKPGMLAAQLGAVVGDPTLASVVPNKPLLALIFKVPQGYKPQDGPPPTALYIPLTPDSPILDTVKEALKNDQTAQLAYDNGLLIIATTDWLDKAKAAESVYRKIVESKLQSDARVYVSITSLMETFGPLIKGQMDQGRDQMLTLLKDPDFPGPRELGMSAETMSQVVRVFFRTVYGFLDQADALQLDVKVKPDSIQIEQLFAAKSGSLLADFFSGTPPPTNSKLQSFLTKGFITYYEGIDAKALAGAFKKAMADIAADPQTAPLTKNEVLLTVQEMLEASGGEAVYSLASGANGPELTAAYTLNDEAKYIDAMQKTMSWFGPESMITKVYSQMGMKFGMKFEKAVREHAGASIHRMTVSMDNPNMGPGAAARMAQFMPKYEVTTTRGYALMSTNAANLDAMIDKIAKNDFPPSAVTLKSMTAFGKNKNFYADMDLVGYMKFAMTKMAPDPQAAEMFNGLKANDPVLMSYAQANGRAMAQVNVPLAPILEMIKLFTALQNGPPKEPETTKEKF